MLSTSLSELRSSSISFVISSSISEGLAPAYVVCTTNMGILISGVSSILEVVRDMTPKNISESTHKSAVTGLFKTNFVSFVMPSALRRQHLYLSALIQLRGPCIDDNAVFFYTAYYLRLFHV